MAQPPAAAAAADSYAATEDRYSFAAELRPIEPLHAAAEVEIASPRAGLDRLWQKYFPDREPGRSVWRGIADVADVFRIFEIREGEAPDPIAAAAKIKALLEEAGGVLQHMDRSGLRNDEQMAEFMIRVIFAKIEACYDIVLASIKLHAAESMQPADFGPANRGMWRYLPKTDEGEKPNAGQRMRIFALNDLSQQGYRRYRENIVRTVRVQTPSGVKNTCAWEQVFSVHDYVKSLTGRRLINQAVWMDLTSGQGISGMKALEEYLCNSDDPEVPEISTDRTVFSFSNGVYLAKQESFVPYEEADRYFPANNYPVACKHHRMPFDPAWLHVADPMQIPTPAFDSIMATQRWSPDVRRWAFVLFGRLFYDVGDFDDWQVVPFLKGLAGTGKSIILNFIREVYEDSDIGIISNTIEKQFGLSAVCDKYLAIADDIRKNMQLDQTEFQNSISGNGVSCAVKFKQPKLVKPWVCTQLWSGNEPPGFHDNSGSVGRRFAVLLFALRVLRPDGTLPERLMAEMAAFICKANRCYRNMVRRHPNEGIWRILPKEFDDQRAELSATSNALVGFLSSEHVRLTRPDEPIENLYVPLEVLCREVTAFAQSHNMEKPAWGPDYYRGPLVQSGLKIGEETQKRYYPRHKRIRIPGRYVFGMDIEVNCELGEENGGDAFAAAAAAAGQSRSAGQCAAGPPKKRQRVEPQTLLGMLEPVLQQQQQQLQQQAEAAQGRAEAALHEAEAPQAGVCQGPAPQAPDGDRMEADD